MSANLRQLSKRYTAKQLNEKIHFFAEDLLDIASIIFENFQLNVRPLQLASVIVAAIEVVTIDQR